MVSARRLTSSMEDTEFMISGATFLDSLTYSSNLASNERDKASCSLSDGI